MRDHHRNGYLAVIVGLVLVPWGPAVAQVEETNPDSAKMARQHLYFGSRDLNGKRFEDAERHFTRAWALSSERNGDAAYYLGRTCNESGRYEEAVAWFEKAVGMIEPASKNHHSATYFLAGLYTQLGNQEEAVKAYQRLLVFPDLEKDRKVSYLHQLVTVSVELKDYKMALEAARSWAELEPDKPELMSTIAELATRTGATDEAVTERERLVALNPEDWGSLEWLAQRYQDSGAHGKALDAYRRLHKHDAENYLYLNGVFEAGEVTGAPRDEQVRLLEKMHKLQPRNLRVLELLAEKTESSKWIDRGLAVDPGNGRLNYMRGEFGYNHWLKTLAPADSLEALSWYQKARKDPQWQDLADRMILTISPPMTAEEKARKEFFDRGKPKAAPVVEGKK